jgi:hypothetical protein
VVRTADNEDEHKAVVMHRRLYSIFVADSPDERANFHVATSLPKLYKAPKQRNGQDAQQCIQPAAKGEVVIASSGCKSPISGLLMRG